MTPFQEAAHTYFPKLELYTSAITRAHGKNHPEVFKVQELYHVIKTKTKDAGARKPDLYPDLAQLRTVTKNYTVPEDVCETYAAVYQMLSEIDRSYQAEHE